LPVVKKFKSPPVLITIGLFVSGDEGIRTLYLLSAIQALSQLSYIPLCPHYRQFNGVCQFQKVIFCISFPAVPLIRLPRP
jgi:hypothetical protein